MKRLGTAVLLGVASRPILRRVSWVLAISLGALLASHPSQAQGSCGNFITKWGSPGSAIGQFDGVEDIAVDTSGNVYVADSGNNRVQKFDSIGGFITEWGNLGSGDGQFITPIGVAVDTSGNVYVTDSAGNDRVQRFDSIGGFITKWGNFGSGDGEFNSPHGVAVDTSGNVYVADSGNDRVQKFDSAGGFITKWGNFGSGDGQFSFPIGVAVDTSGNVYVADSINNRVQKFDSAGGFITKWGNLGSGDGQFSFPSGVGVDSIGGVYVADSGNDRVQKFDSNGVFTNKWGSSGSGNGQFFGPWRVATDTGGIVYVADQGNDRVQKFLCSSSVPVCSGDIHLSDLLSIDATAEDGGGIAGISLAPGSVNLTLGGTSPESFSSTIRVGPLDPTLDASGGVVFTDFTAQTCELPVSFVMDPLGEALCEDSGVSLTLLAPSYTSGGVCDVSFQPCVTTAECPPTETCVDVCRGGFNDGLPCTLDAECATGLPVCVGGAFNGAPCATDADCPPDGSGVGKCIGTAGCSRRMVECASHAPRPTGEPAMPPGYAQSPFCPIMSVRTPEIGPPALLELLEVNGNDPDLRLMLSRFDPGTCSFLPFSDVTTLVDQICVPDSPFEGPGQGGIRDEGLGDLGGPGTGPFEIQCANGETLRPGVKITCASFVGVICPDPSLDNVDTDGDGYCPCGVCLTNPGQEDCSDANPNINPGAPEICNGVDDNCDLVLLDSDFDGVEDCLDCNPGDPFAQSEPAGAVIDLIFIDKQNLSWSAASCPGGIDVFYDTIRSPDPTDFSTTETCVGSNDFATSAFDSGMPPLGSVYYYLVRPENSCAVGPMLPDSGGVPRTADQC